MMVVTSSNLGGATLTEAGHAAPTDATGGFSSNDAATNGVSSATGGGGGGGGGGGDGGGEAEEMRRLFFNHPERNVDFQFCSNYVSTSKYNIFTFLPKFLFQEFSR